MKRVWMRVATLGLLAAAVVQVGCSVMGAASTGLNIGKNMGRKDSHLKISLDGAAATQDQLKKAATGYAKFKVAEPVGTAPRLRFEIADPDKFGRITMVQCQIHQKFQADYSHQAEFTVYSKNVNDPMAQMKPGTDYNLGSPGSEFEVLNYKNEKVGGVDLKPGMEYMLVLTVKADNSETAQVYFKTK